MIWRRQKSVNRRRRIKRRRSIWRWLVERSANKRVRSESQPLKGRLLGRLVVAARFTLKAVAVLIGAAVGVGGGYYGYQQFANSTYFNIQHFEISGLRSLTANAVLPALEQAKGRAIFDVDLARLTRAVVAHPWIREVEVGRVLPNTLTVKVVEQRAKAAVLMGRIYLVNGDGEIFKRVEAKQAEDLPMITGITREQHLKESAAGTTSIRRALAALDEYYDGVRPPLSEIHLGSEGSLTLFLRTGGTALRFGRQLDIKRLGRLDAVLANLGEDLRKVRALYLDNDVHPERVVVRMVRD